MHAQQICPVSAKIDTRISRKGTRQNGREKETIYTGVQVQSGVGKLAARYDTRRGVSEYTVSSSMVSRWRQALHEIGPEIFSDQCDPMSRRKALGYEPGESPDDLKKLIGELTVQNDILKKSERHF